MCVRNKQSCPVKNMAHITVKGFIQPNNWIPFTMKAFQTETFLRIICKFDNRTFPYKVIFNENFYYLQLLLVLEFCACFYFIKMVFFYVCLQVPRDPTEPLQCESLYWWELQWIRSCCRIRYRQVTLRPRKGLRFLVTGRIQNRSGDVIHVNMDTWLLEPDQFFHTQSMVSERGLTNRASIHTPMWNSHLKHSAVEFQLIQQFWL